MRYQKINYDYLLERVEKPGRYTNSEVNAFHKEPSIEKACFCFAYPDVYEVGFSHQGIKIFRMDSCFRQILETLSTEII